MISQKSVMVDVSDCSDDSEPSDFIMDLPVSDYTAESPDSLLNAQAFLGDDKPKVVFSEVAKMTNPKSCSQLNLLLPNKETDSLETTSNTSLSSLKRQQLIKRKASFKVGTSFKEKHKLKVCMEHKMLDSTGVTSGESNTSPTLFHVVYDCDKSTALGVGSMSVVYRCTKRVTTSPTKQKRSGTTQNPLVVKVTTYDSEHARICSENEFAILKRLNHKSIV